MPFFRASMYWVCITRTLTLFFVLLQKHQNMEVFDYILLAIAGTALITGAVSGLVRRVASIAGLVAAIAVCWFFGDAIADTAIKLAPEQSALMRSLAFAVVFVLVYLAVRLLGGLFRSALSALKLGPVDRLAGALFSLFLWMLGVSIVMNIYMTAAPSRASGLLQPDRPWRGAVAALAPAVLDRVTSWHNFEGFADVIPSAEKNRD